MTDDDKSVQVKLSATRHGDGVEIHTIPLRLLVAFKMQPARNDVAMEMGMPSEPLLSDEPGFGDKEEHQEWLRRYFEETEGDPVAKYEAEWRVRFRWADAAIRVMNSTAREAGKERGQ